jgi:hypothetical protein
VAETPHRPLSTADPRRSPSYPQRVHIRERAHWQSVVKTWQDRVAAAASEIPSKPDRPAAERTYAQMLGAVDQIADAARRMPMEVGELYEEDHHRLEEAVAALERLFARW